MSLDSRLLNLSRTNELGFSNKYQIETNSKRSIRNYIATNFQSLSFIVTPLIFQTHIKPKFIYLGYISEGTARIGAFNQIKTFCSLLNSTQSSTNEHRNLTLPPPSGQKIFWKFRITGTKCAVLGEILKMCFFTLAVLYNSNSFVR